MADTHRDIEGNGGSLALSLPPCGGTDETPDVEVLKAVLDGIDILLTQNVSPR